LKTNSLLLLIFLPLDGTTVQCGPQPPQWNSYSQLFFTSISSFNLAFINIRSYTVSSSKNIWCLWYIFH